MFVVFGTTFFAEPLSDSVFRASEFHTCVGAVIQGKASQSGLAPSPSDPNPAGQGACTPQGYSTRVTLGASCATSFRIGLSEWQGRTGGRSGMSVWDSCTFGTAHKSRPVYTLKDWNATAAADPSFSSC